MASRVRKTEDTSKMTKKELINKIIGKKPRKKFLSQSQKEYYDVFSFLFLG